MRKRGSLKATPTLTETYVYDAFGKLAAEYSTAAPTAGGTFYRTTDHLGSTRLVTKQDKSDADCYDYAPFGEEIPNTLGNRSSNACFAASFDGRHKFTGKERDNESDLDYFLARYYSGPIGRFLSVDPLLNSGRPDDPQTWNKYLYVGGNPLRFTDPLGLYRFAVKCATGDDQCNEQQQRFRDALAAARASANALQEGSKERKQLERSLKRIGEKEGKGAWIAFGDLEGTKEGRANPLTNTIKFDLAQIDSNIAAWTRSGKAVAGNPAFTQNDAASYFAATVAHEGAHLAGSPLGLITNPFRTEQRAIFTESAYYQGQNVLSPRGLLWNPSWANTDRRIVESNRRQGLSAYRKLK